jgi:hypothetical protein
MKQQPDLNKTIDKIENALHELSLNPKGGWTELMKSWGTPYYGNITNVLRKRGIAEPEGTGLKWVRSVIRSNSFRSRSKSQPPAAMPSARKASQAFSILSSTSLTAAPGR